MSSTRRGRRARGTPGAAAAALLLVLGLAGAPGPSRAAPPDAAGRVDEVAFEPKGLLVGAEIRQLLAARVPGDWDEPAVEKTRQNLLATGRFLSVEARRSESGGRGLLTFVLAPSPFVRTVDFEGAKQVGRRDLRARLDLKAWGPLADEPLRSVPGQVADAYERAGFPRPDVVAEPGSPGKAGETRVRVTVKETPLPVLASFGSELGEIPFLSGLQTRARLLVFRWGARGHLNRKRLEELTRTEQRRLRTAGWKGATLKVEEEARPEGTGVRVVLDLGPREKVKGKGVERTVLSEVEASWKRRNVSLSDGVANRLTRSATEGMKEKGWLDATVKGTMNEDGGRKTLLLAAERGTRSWVAKVRFEGTAGLPGVKEKDLRTAVRVEEPRLLGIIRTRPGPKALAESVERLGDLLHANGFPDAKVSSRIEDAPGPATVVFTVEAGARRTIASVSFPGAVSIDGKKLAEVARKARIAPGLPYSEERAAKAASDLKDAFGALGHDVAQVTPRPGAADPAGALPIAFEVVEGPAYLLGPTIVAGNRKTSAGRILALRDSVRGRPVDAKKLAEHHARLSSLGIFDSVSVKPVEIPGTSPGEKAVLVDVRERPSGFAEYGIDLNTQRGLELAGTLGEKDLFGQAVTGSVSALVGKERQNFVLSLSQPVLFGLHVYNGLQASYTNDATYEGFTLVTLAADLGLSWEFREKDRFSLRYRLERQTPTDIAPDFGESAATEVARIGSLTPSLTFDQRDDPFVPTLGWFALGQVKASRKALGGDSEFNRWEVDGRYYKTVGEAVTFAVAARVGVAKTLGETELPVGERFYPGGANTHRGFREKGLGPLGTDGSPLGGQSYGLFNAEVRFPLLGPFEAGAFLDVGNAWLEGIDLSDLRWAAGAGLRLKTPVGPLRVDVGFKLDKKEGESPAIVHVALGYPF